MDMKKIAEGIAAPYIEAAGKLPEELKDNQFTKKNNPNPKGNDRDGDGKTNEAKPFKGTEVPRGVVAALTFQGEIKIYEANDPKSAHGIKTALMEREGEYARIIHGPNREGMTVNELYDHFEERWAGCEKLPAGPMRDNCEKKNKGKSEDKKDDSKSDDKKDDKKPDFLKKKD